MGIRSAIQFLSITSTEQRADIELSISDHFERAMFSTVSIFARGQIMQIVSFILAIDMHWWRNHFTPIPSPAERGRAGVKEWPLRENHSLPSFHPHQMAGSMKSVSFTMWKADNWEFVLGRVLAADAAVLRLAGILSDLSVPGITLPLPVPSKDGPASEHWIEQTFALVQCLVGLAN